MKIFLKRRLNSWYKEKNVLRVSELKEGEEVILTTIGPRYLNVDGEMSYNTLQDGYNLSSTIAMFTDNIKETIRNSCETNRFETEIYEKDYPHRICYAKNGISIGVNTEENFIYISVVLDSDLIDNIKKLYKENDVITFEVITLGMRNLDENRDVNTDLKMVLCFYIEVINEATDEEIIEFYKLITNRTISKYHYIKSLTFHEECPILSLSLRGEKLEELVKPFIEVADKIIETNNTGDVSEAYKLIEEYFANMDEIVHTDILRLLDIYNNNGRFPYLWSKIFS